MYDLRNIHKQEPSAISAALVVLVNAVVVFFNVNISGDQLAQINTALVVLLSLFYVRPLTASKDALSKLNKR